MYSATGNVPVGRRYHTAVLSTDGISIIICCGGTSKDSVNLNDVAVLNTQTWLWTQPSIDGVAPTARYAPSSAMVNGQMIVFFGTDNEFNCLNDVNVLDTRKTPFQWTSSFTSNTSPNGLTIVGGIGGVIGISIAVLIIIAILIFLVVRKPWRKAKDHPEPNKVPTDQYIYNAEPNRQPLEAHQTQMANLYTPYANSGPPANQYNSYIEARPPAGQYISYADARPSANQYNSYAEARPSPQTHQMPPPMYQKQFNSQHNPFANPDGPPMQIEQRVDSVLPVSEIVYSKPNVLLEIVNTKPDVKD
ncbi:hypothetical protein BC938DRAFT_479969 [Jimgerdemannia flammicorona]|uniref:Uncharacterized protein n=1 Tax=Jimgerdemannia flammicorona TaxID=994334 RepID=A0A433QJP3_9FUNG|nr:hypothetical protein BC938DRAFT_479969 [Jimgerdemannia flammicorona]